MRKTRMIDTLKTLPAVASATAIIGAACLELAGVRLPPFPRPEPAYEQITRNPFTHHQSYVHVSSAYQLHRKIKPGDYIEVDGNKIEVINQTGNEILVKITFSKKIRNDDGTMDWETFAGTTKMSKTDFEGILRRTSSGGTEDPVYYWFEYSSLYGPRSGRQMRTRFTLKAGRIPEDAKLVGD